MWVMYVTNSGARHMVHMLPQATVKVVLCCQCYVALRWSLVMPTAKPGAQPVHCMAINHANHGGYGVKMSCF